MGRTRKLDRQLFEGSDWLAGVDEAGRGALAGPVVAAAVLIQREWLDSSWCRCWRPKIGDSKQLAPEARTKIVQAFQAHCRRLGSVNPRGYKGEGKGIRWGIGWAEIGEIEELNILRANSKAMERALKRGAGDAVSLPLANEAPGPLFELTEIPACRIVLDGREVANFRYRHTGMIGGDDRSVAIGLASILAKTYRDAWMVRLETEFSGFGFGIHKGYGTPSHLEAIRRLGPSPVHRKLFLRKVLG